MCIWPVDQYSCRFCTRVVITGMSKSTHLTTTATSPLRPSAANRHTDKQALHYCRQNCVEKGGGGAVVCDRTAPQVLDGWAAASRLSSWERAACMQLGLRRMHACA